MYRIEKCNDKFWCLFDVVTTTPPLLAFRYIESELLSKALGTQKSELDSIKLFYDFWLTKFSISLDYFLYQSNYQDVPTIAGELDAFWDYLLAGKKITNVVALPASGSVKKMNKRKRTAAKRCVDVCRFIKFLSKTYITPQYSAEHFSRLKSHQRALNSTLDELREKYHKFSSSSKAASSSNSLRSMTSEQFGDFMKVLAPNKVRPNKNNPHTFSVIEVNSLNPTFSFDIQMRNYLITTLEVNYGLRVGESLLLHEKSFLPFRSDKNRFLMRVRNLEDEHGDIEDFRTHKPSIKTSDSVRDIEITRQHYKQIMVYYKFIRPQKCEHEYIFASHRSPYKPLSYSTYMTEFSKYAESFRQNYPEHFNPEYAESLEDDITPHWLRHTWAYGTLSVIYEETRKEYTSSGVVNLSGLMEDAKDKLRVQGGWSNKSQMPSKYAKRFIQEEANRTLLNIFYNNQQNLLIDELEDWDEEF